MPVQRPQMQIIQEMNCMSLVVLTGQSIIFHAKIEILLASANYDTGYV